jgi:hypothetical protein
VIRFLVFGQRLFVACFMFCAEFGTGVAFVPERGSDFGFRLLRGHDDVASMR